MSWFHRYERYRDEGICYGCGGKARPGRVLCQPCADKKAMKARLARKNATPRVEPAWKSGNENRAQRRRAGRCTRCGGVPEKNRTMCRPCMNRKNAKQRAADALARARGELPRCRKEGRDLWAENARPADKVADEMHRMAVLLAAGKFHW